MTTTVVNKRGHHFDEPGDVYIGRPSKWGNPFAIGDPDPLGDEPMDRATVIERYRVYLMATPKLRDAVGELKGKRLVCWCSPLPCHGDVLAALAEATP